MRLRLTHICGKGHNRKHFTVYRKTIGKRMGATLKKIQQELRRKLHGSIGNTVKWLQSVVRGYFQYPALPDNQERMKALRGQVPWIWYRQLWRRSQRSRWTWKRFRERLGNLLPEVTVPHPYPDVRFDAKHLR